MSKLPIQTIIRIIYFWCCGSNQKSAQEMTGVSKVTLSTWYGLCRDICTKDMLSCSMEVGGQGHIVEIDETSLKKKRKYNRGKCYEDNWLFGGVDRATGNITL